MYEATFLIRGDVAYADATASGDARVELWCNEHCDLLHVRGDATDAVRAEVEAAVGVADVVERGREAIVVTERCLRPHTEGNVERYLERHDCLLLPPLRYEDGGKLEGKVDGNLLIFDWKDPGSKEHAERTMSGRGYLKLVKGKNKMKLKGEWGYDDNATGAGPWTAEFVRELESGDPMRLKDLDSEDF